MQLRHFGFLASEKATGITLHRLPMQTMTLALVWLLGACAAPVRVTPPTETPAPVTRPGPANEQPATQADADISRTIREQAIKAISAGQFTNASRLLDRAVRLSPRQPSNYYEFARLRLKQNRPDQAQQFVTKGLSLNPDPALQAQLEGLLDTDS